MTTPGATRHAPIGWFAARARRDRCCGGDSRHPAGAFDPARAGRGWSCCGWGGRRLQRPEPRARRSERPASCTGTCDSARLSAAAAMRCVWGAHARLRNMHGVWRCDGDAGRGTRPCAAHSVPWNAGQGCLWTTSAVDLCESPRRSTTTCATSPTRTPCAWGAHARRHNMHGVWRRDGDAVCSTGHMTSSYRNCPWAEIQKYVRASTD